MKEKLALASGVLGVDIAAEAVMLPPLPPLSLYLTMLGNVSRRDGCGTEVDDDVIVVVAMVTESGPGW